MIDKVSNNLIKNDEFYPLEWNFVILQFLAKEVLSKIPKDDKIAFILKYTYKKGGYKIFGIERINKN